MTRRKKILISIPLIILIVGIGGFFYISSDSFLNNFIKPRFEKAFQKQVNEKYTVTFGELSGNIFTGVEVRDFRIEDDKKLSILSTDEIVLKYNFFALLQRKFLVTALEINAPELNLRRNSEGQVNLTQMLRKTAPEPESTNNSFAFAISKAVINEGKILFTDTQQNIELELPNIKLGLKGPLDNWNHRIEGSIGDGSFILNGTRLPTGRLENIDFSLSAKSGELSETLKLQLGNSFLEVMEFERNWDSGEWNTLVEITIDATDVQKLLGNDTQLAGLGKVVLNLTGTDSTLNGTLAGTSEALSIKQIQSTTDSSESNIRQIDIKELAFNTTINLEEVPKVTLDKFSAQLAGGTLTGKGNAAFDNIAEGNLLARLQHFVNQPITYDSSWQISNVQLRSLLSMFVELPAETPQIESGIFTGSVQIKGNTTGNFYLDSNVQLSETNLLVGDGLKLTSLKDSSLNLEISSTPENGSNITADGTIDSTTVAISGSYESLNVQLESVDFGKLFKIFNTIPFKGIGRITAEIKKDGTANGYAEVPEAFYCHNDDDPIPVGRLTGNFRYIDRVVYFENTHLTKRGGTSVSIAGNIGIDGKLPANFRIVPDPLVLDADYNKLFFTIAYPIEGNMKGELKLYGQLIDHLDGEGNFFIDSAKAWNINLDPTTLPLKIDDYALTIPNFVITARGQQVILNANVESNGDFDFSLKNSPDKPVQLVELARAADITDLPLDGKMDVEIKSYQKKPHALVFTTKFIFSNLTFEDNPLGDAHLDGILIEEKNHFKFTGKALTGTTDIEGTISNSEPNPYKFTLKSEKTAVTPILRIFNPALDAIIGTIDSTVKVEGTIAELFSTEPVEPSKKRVYPYDVDIIIDKTQLEYNSLRFTNPKPMHLRLEDDIFTIFDGSLSVHGDESPFIQLTGTLDTRTEELDLSSKHNQMLMLESLGAALGFPISGTAQYDLRTKGTLGNPIVDLKWTVPMLIVETEIGNISIGNANGEIKFQDNTLHIKPFQILVLNNPLQIGGNIDIDQNVFNNSKLNIGISGDNFDLTKFSDLVRNSLPVEAAKHLTLDESTVIQGNIGISLNVLGSITAPVVDLNLHTIENHPIHFGVFAKPITLEKLHALTTITKKSVEVRDLIANGQIGKGSFEINGETSFSTRNGEEMMFDMGTSFQKLEIGDFVTLYQQKPSFVNGLISGAAKIAGTGFTPDLIAATCNIDELNLHAHNYQLSNTSPIDFKLNNSGIISRFPLRITSSVIDTKVDVNLDGPLATPNISAKWDGTFKHTSKMNTDLPLQWQGNVEYANKQIKLRTELTNNGDKLTLSGTIPFDLTLAEIDFSERFLDVPIENVRLTGKELPLTFFPGVDAVFSATESVVDIDLKLQGTTRTPYLEGNVFFQAPHLRLNNFNQPFENVTVQLAARKDAIEFAKFQFNIEDEDGVCNLEQSELQLDGLTPKLFLVKGLSLKQYPLDLTLRQAIRLDTFEDVNGQVTATLTELEIPFESFFENGKQIPIPKIREVITFDRLSQKAKAKFSIDDISFSFMALDQKYKFENPERIPISLNAGEFKVETLKLENTIPIPSAAPQEPLIFTCYGRWNMHGGIFLNLKLHNFNISVTDQLLPEDFRDAYKLNGILSTEINITGVYEAPKVTVKFDGDRLTINQANIDKFSAELHYSHVDRHWKIQDNTEILRLGNNRLLCSGRVPYILSFSKFQAEPLPEPMEVTFTTELEDLEILPHVDPFIQSANGEGTISATIYGTPKAPQLRGSGEFNQVSLKLVDSPVSFERLNASFDLSETGLKIEHLEAELNDGNFSAYGEITSNWLKLDQINLSARLENCNFVQPGIYQINVSADNMHLHGNITKPILDGDITINSGQYQQNWDWEDVLDSFTARTVSETDIFSDAPILRDLTLNLGIDIPNSFHLLSSTGGATDIEIKCSGQLTGRIQEPIFTGTLSIPKGRISILTQIFEIDEGSTITNLDKNAFNPELDISLKTPNPIRGVLLSDGSTADVMVTASVTGVLENADIDKAKLSFGAEPLNSSTTEVFTDADVLALLSPDNFLSLSFGGFTFTVSSGFDPDERHIIAEYPFSLFGRKIPIKIEREKDEFGVGVQLLEGRF
ncbi:hypothetical protein C6501_01720 [Candidatus Poribacteria bacterium]|nr:MAG: hypothetical protein C6501_01720 [Candidatus Poribacteria bacterium]